MLIMFFFAGYLNIHSDILGLKNPFIHFTKEVEEFWEILSWIVFGVLFLDIGLKYNKIRDPKLFVRKHWLDLLMLCLMPLFAGFKVAKFSVKLVKGLKMIKSGLKAAHGAKKIGKLRS